MIKNIDTALTWADSEGVINYDSKTLELWIMEDGEFEDLYKLNIAEGWTTLDIDNFAIEVIKNSLDSAFHDGDITKAGLNFDDMGEFKKLLMELKKCY
jgi:hypothetical protein